MTWAEAQAAFRAQLSVIYQPMHGKAIPCIRIAELILSCDDAGNIRRSVSGLDRTKTLYRDAPERFTAAPSAEEGR